MGDPTPCRTPGPWRAPSRAGQYTRSVGAIALNQPPGLHPPSHYELWIEGHLDEYWSAWFGRLSLIRKATTTLRGAVTDQAELHGCSPRYGTSSPA
jgi:hypothetical protein